VADDKTVEFLKFPLNGRVGADMFLVLRFYSIWNIWIFCSLDKENMGRINNR